MQQYELNGRSYDMRGLMRLSGRSGDSIRMRLRDGETLEEAILPRISITTEDGHRKYVARDPNVPMEYRGKEQTLLEWALELGCSTKEALHRIAVWERQHNVAKAKPGYVSNQKVYRVRYIIFHRDYQEIRFTDVSERELHSFLYDHLFSRVVGEKEV